MSFCSVLTQAILVLDVCPLHLKFIARGKGCESEYSACGSSGEVDGWACTGAEQQNQTAGKERKDGEAEQGVRSWLWGSYEGTANPFTQMFPCLSICVAQAVYALSTRRFAGKDVAPYSGRFAVRVIKDK